MTESHEVTTGRAGGALRPAVAFVAPQSVGRFVLAYGGPPSTNPVLVRYFDYPSEAILSLYGVGCGMNPILSPRPWAGSEFFRVRLGNLSNGTPAFFLLGFAQAAIDLGPIGMPGCALDVVPASDLPAAAQGGYAEVRFALPDLPLLIGDLYGQWVWAQPGANALGLLASRGIEIRVR